MRAGALDRRITILKPAKIRNEFNEEEESWLEFATVWASKEDVSDGERVRAQQVGSNLTTRFQILYSTKVAAVDTTFQVQLGQRLFNVLGVKEIGRREGLEISAVALGETS